MKIVTARDATEWLQGRFGFEKSQGPRTCLHDFMHVLSNGVGGAVCEEYKAAIAEDIVLGTFTNFIGVADDRIVPDTWSAKFTAFHVGGFYSSDAIASNDKLHRMIMEAVVPDDTAADQLAEINRRMVRRELDARETAQTATRMTSINDFFQDTHQGRRLADFRLTDIFNMELREFGVVPVARPGIVDFRFAPG